MTKPDNKNFYLRILVEKKISKKKKKKNYLKGGGGGGGGAGEWDHGPPMP